MVDRARQILRLATTDRDWDIPVLEPTPRIEGSFVSAALLAQKAKQFDDGLYAAVELAVQSGAGRFPAKRALIQAALASIEDAGAAEILYSAARLGGADIEPPDALAAAVESRTESFLADPLGSKPLGFYTWTPELTRIFQQDRALQTEIVGPAAEALAGLLQDSEFEQAYTQCVKLASKLTNRLASPDLRSWAPGQSTTFFPPSAAHETELVKRLYGDKPIPDGFSLIDELIASVREGRISLTPRKTSGWYDFQSRALEPLIEPRRAPESERLSMGDEYRRALEALGKGCLSLARETHVKQLEVAMPASSAAGWRIPQRKPIYVSPQISVEPLYGHYLRRAIGYGFVRSVLEPAFGEQAIEDMRRITPEGPVDVKLREELDHIAALFYGASVIAARELGFTNEQRCALETSELAVAAQPSSSRLGSGRGPEADARQFKDWARMLSQDVDLRGDARMMVPVFHDLQRRKTKVWAFLGWSRLPLTIQFDRRPEMRAFDWLGREAGVKLEMQAQLEPLAIPVTAEVYVSSPMDREEFRAHCDRYKTEREILAALRD